MGHKSKRYTNYRLSPKIKNRNDTQVVGLRRNHRLGEPIENLYTFVHIQICDKTELICKNNNLYGPQIEAIHKLLIEPKNPKQK